MGIIFNTRVVRRGRWIRSRVWSIVGSYRALAKNLWDSKSASRSERFFTTFRMTFWVAGIIFNTRAVEG